jgi:hypothetical protein
MRTRASADLENLKDQFSFKDYSMRRSLPWFAAGLALVGLLMVSSEAQATNPYRRVVTSFSYPSVPMTTYPSYVTTRRAYAPVVVAPTVTAAPVVVAAPVYGAAPAYAVAPAYAPAPAAYATAPTYAAPVVTASPVVVAPVVRGRRHWYAPAVVAPAPATTYYAPSY